MEVMASVLAFAATVAGHSVLVRTRLPGSGIIKYAMLASIVGLVLLAALAALAGPLESSALVLLVALVLYWFLCEFYLFLFASIGTSISMKLLRTLLQRDMSPGEIEGVYDPREMVEKRLCRLHAAGLLDRVSMRVTAKGRLLAWVFGVLRSIVIVEPKRVKMRKPDSALVKKGATERRPAESAS